jgi:hypothetical protein
MKHTIKLLKHWMWKNHRKKFQVSVDGIPIDGEIRFGNRWMNFRTELSSIPTTDNCRLLGTIIIVLHNKDVRKHKDYRTIRHDIISEVSYDSTIAEDYR